MFDRIVVQEIDISTLTSSISPHLQTIATQIVSDLLEAMSINTNLNDVIERIHKDYGIIPLKAFIQTNEHFKLKFEFLADTHSSASEIVQKHMSKLQDTYIQLKVYSKTLMKKQLYMQGQSGSQLPGYMVCQLCENQILTNQLENVDTLVFYCGHKYHTKCVEDFIQPTTCPICIENPTTYCKIYISFIHLIKLYLKVTNISVNKNFTKNITQFIQTQQEKEEQAKSAQNLVNQKFNGWILNSEYTPKNSSEKGKIKQSKSKMLEKLQRFDKKKKEKLKESHLHLYSLQSKF